MLRTVKVSLDRNNMEALGAMVTHCNVRQWIPNELDCGETWNCDYCEQPLVFRAWDGLWYHVGNKVFD